MNKAFLKEWAKQTFVGVFFVALLMALVVLSLFCIVMFIKNVPYGFPISCLILFLAVMGFSGFHSAKEKIEEKKQRRLQHFDLGIRGPITQPLIKKPKGPQKSFDTESLPELERES